MRKKQIIIILLVIVILSFAVPVRKDYEWVVIENPNPLGFFGQGPTIVEKYEVYYNIYGIPIFRLTTGERNGVA